MTSWRNHTAYSQRAHHYGPIEPALVERPVFTAWGFVGGVLFTAACLGVIVGAVMLAQAVMS